MQIVEKIDSWHRRAYPNRPHYVGIVKHQEVRMGELAFIMSHKVNGVSALHSDLVKQNLFPELNRLHPGRIINQTNGVTPRRWLRKSDGKPIDMEYPDDYTVVWKSDKAQWINPYYMAQGFWEYAKTMMKPAAYLREHQESRIVRQDFPRARQPSEICL